MNFYLPFLPERENKPRANGIAMVMDKGLSLRQADDLIQSSGHLIDYVKLGFGTSIITNNLSDKIRFYQSNNIRTYFGGTLFEAFAIRNMFDDYRNLLNQHRMECVEISDGSMNMPHDKKCEYIHTLSKDFEVLSEVGSKDASINIPPQEWVEQMRRELDAGSFKVIGEARESGTVGLFDKQGQANTDVIDQITNNLNIEDIIWEAPIKSQQIWFIKHFGANVNLGNINPNEIIPLETLRLGLRGDTFMHFLPSELK
ncbi:MAG: phosphosulfolactate synthase [Hyphomicrobiales bacterium]